jgi:hypothetical protein
MQEARRAVTGGRREASSEQRGEWQRGREDEIDAERTPAPSRDESARRSLPEVRAHERDDLTRLLFLEDPAAEGRCGDVPHPRLGLGACPVARVEPAVAQPDPFVRTPEPHAHELDPALTEFLHQRHRREGLRLVVRQEDDEPADGVGGEVVLGRHSLE